MRSLLAFEWLWNIFYKRASVYLLACLHYPRCIRNGSRFHFIHTLRTVGKELVLTLAAHSLTHSLPAWHAHSPRCVQGAWRVGAVHIDTECYYFNKIPILKMLEIVSVFAWRHRRPGDHKKCSRDTIERCLGCRKNGKAIPKLFTWKSKHLSRLNKIIQKNINSENTTGLTWHNGQLAKAALASWSEKKQFCTRILTTLFTALRITVQWLLHFICRCKI